MLPHVVCGCRVLDKREEEGKTLQTLALHPPDLYQELDRFKHVLHKLTHNFLQKLIEIFVNQFPPVFCDATVNTFTDNLEMKQYIIVHMTIYTAENTHWLTGLKSGLKKPPCPVSLFT